ncbi:MAG: hypothetical protein QNJ72_33490 [Pleurocapsa sp. MO_226.B13]|nr:hypothetical protein [Pleurocapsa sp. MO_226.B13]
MKAKIDFWNLKHQIDDQAARLGWSKAKCKAYILETYGKDSRLKMTDDQLLDLLERLRTFNSRAKAVGKLKLRLGKKRR